jgi:phosphotriesterase-related protein
VVNSVLGPVDAGKLGFTLMHEHVIGAAAGIPQVYPKLLGAGFMEHIVEELTKAKHEGIDTIIDATTHDLGRDVTLLAEASRRSGINVIASTGWWLEIFHDLTGVSANQFADLFIREIEDGIAGTNIKAGILKAASDISGVTPKEEIILRGVSRAHLQTKVPIMLHSFAPSQVAKRQLAILREEGADLRRVKVDHCLDTTDTEYLIWILDQGCYLGVDRLPGASSISVSMLSRIRTIKTLIDAGYADRLLLSHDWVLAPIVADSPVALRQELKAANPYGFLFIKKVVLPRLEEMGVSKAILENLCVGNPRNFFENLY